MKENKYIDLSILLTKDTPVFPGKPNIIFKKHANIKENTYNEHQITINTPGTIKNNEASESNLREFYKKVI